MDFFAIQFSKALSGLLIFSFFTQGQAMNGSKASINVGDKISYKREEIPVNSRWNVEALFVDPESWKLELLTVMGGEKFPKWPELQAFKGKMRDPSSVKNFFESFFRLDRKLEKLHVYAHLRLDEDLGNDFFKSGFGSISTLIHEFGLEMAWVNPEFLALEEGEFRHLLDHPLLAEYRFYLEKIGRMRAHTLAPEQEELLALSSKALGVPAQTFSALNNADLTFVDVVDSKGKAHPLSNATYGSYMMSSDRELRKNAFQNLHRGFQAHVNTFCELLQGEVNQHFFMARARKFSSCLEAALYPKNVPKAVYENLIKAVREHLPLVHKYVALKKKLLGLDKLHAYDLYASLVEESKEHLGYSEARDAVIASVSLLGDEYQSALKKGLVEDRWVDVYENTRKRSGAYSSGCYDSMPYILMNYHGTLSDMLTLAHEAGHSMHSLLSRTHQPYVYAQYPIFVAEVASTFNEQLFLDHLKSENHSKTRQAFLLNFQIERIRTTIIRQTLFAEFELYIHECVEKGETLTPTLLNQHYAKLCREYYGPDLIVDPELEVEWARIPHFYTNFYVYQYATGLSAALALHGQVVQDNAAKARYVKFLSSGGSQFPIDLLKTAGVDMETSDPVHAAMRHFGKLLDDFQQCF